MADAHTWDGIAAGYKAELEDLAMQWQQIDGFSVSINEDTLRRMADAGVTSLRDMGQWIYHNAGWGSLIRGKVWLWFGMDQSTYMRQLGDYQDAFERYTGTRPDLNMHMDTQQPSDAYAQMLFDAFSQGLSQSALTEKLLHDENTRSAYGWIKYGLTFDDFQQKKTDFRVTFGQDLSNEQAILQLQYLHQAQGASRQVTAPAPAGQAPAPEISEVEVR